MAEERKVEFAGNGTIKKCPNCGVQLDVFQARCPACGFAISGVEKDNTLQKFADMYINERDKERKLEMIDTFPIPNTIEDTIEFAILAVQQIKSFSTRQKENMKVGNPYMTLIGQSFGISDIFSRKKITDNDFLIAWKNKLDQVCQKARLAYPNDKASLQHLDMLVKDAENALGDFNKKKKNTKIKKAILLGAMIVLCAVSWIKLENISDSMDMKKDAKTQQLEKMFTEIQADIKEGNYDDAELKLLDFDVRYEGDAWREKKEFLKKRLEEAKEKAGE